MHPKLPPWTLCLLDLLQEGSLGPMHGPLVGGSGGKHEEGRNKNPAENCSGTGASLMPKALRQALQALATMLHCLLMRGLCEGAGRLRLTPPEDFVMKQCLR